MDFQCIVGAYRAGVVNPGFLLQPVEEAFDELAQAAHAAIVVFFPLVLRLDKLWLETAGMYGNQGGIARARKEKPGAISRLSVLS